MHEGSAFMHKRMRKNSPLVRGSSANMYKRMRGASASTRKRSSVSETMGGPPPRNGYGGPTSELPRAFDGHSTSEALPRAFLPTSPMASLR